MNWKKAVLLGVGLWVAMFAIVSVFMALGLYTSGEPSLLSAVAAGVVSYVLAGHAKPKDQKEALTYGATWVVVGVLLDAVVTLKFAPTLFQMWTLWVAYVLVLIAPVLRVKK